MHFLQVPSEFIIMDYCCKLGFLSMKFSGGKMPRFPSISPLKPVTKDGLKYIHVITNPAILSWNFSANVCWFPSKYQGSLHELLWKEPISCESQPSSCYTLETVFSFSLLDLFSSLIYCADPFRASFFCKRMGYKDNPFGRFLCHLKGEYLSKCLSPVLLSVPSSFISYDFLPWVALQSYCPAICLTKSLHFMSYLILICSTRIVSKIIVHVVLLRCFICLNFV